MNFRIHVAVVAALAAVLPAAGLADEPIARCTVQRPTGSYSLVKLHFDVPGAKEIDEDYARWTLMGGLRGDAMLVPHGIGLGTPGGQLTLTDEKLSGTFDHCPKPGKRGGKVVRVVVNATVSDNKVSGTATIGEHDGKVTGTITPEAELAKANDVPADVGWPSLLGPVAGGAAAESTPVELVDDPKNIRLVWAPEETDIGQGVGSISRFMDKWRDASQRRTCSGSTSPVAANGRVYLSYFVPTPAEAPSEKAIEKLAEGSDLSSDKLPWYALEKIYPKSDDVVLCMDAETGKTLWKATVSARGRNHQHHKEGPFDMTPGVGGGRVFAIGMSGYLYAFDAETGKPLWEQPLKNGHRSLYSSTALPGRKVVVVPLQGKWAGFDVKTGKLAWHSDIRHEHVTLALYPVGDKDYFIGGSGDRIVCLDGADGKVVWSVDAKALSHGRGLGCGGISIYGDHMIAYLQEGDNRKDHKPHCAAWRIDGAKTPAML
ncbi:MAG: PQQ-binding-like beta-propeller repeat protein [Phycisphaerae bacterium]